VRSSLVKRNEQRARVATAWLASLPGVSSVRSNTLTGSLTVTYDPVRTEGQVILSALKGQGWLQAPMPAPSSSVTNRESTTNSDLAAKIAGRLAVYTLERAAELSIRALVSAVL
jgi:hypothetical protein